jgi:hypothetical protein
MPLKKIFKPVAKVLDKIIPNEIKPALPYLAAFAPIFGPPGVQNFLGETMKRRMLTSGLLNIGAQLSQEGNEGDVNLISAGIGALSGAMTAPGASDYFSMRAGLAGEGTGLMSQAQKVGFDTLAKGSNFLKTGGIDTAGGTTANLLSKEGAAIATVPTATATGDVMEAEARRLQKQQIIDDALEAAEALADSGSRAAAIRNAMSAYDFFTEQEIEDTIASAGYKAGGRVGFKFGGIDEAIEMVEKETVEKGKEGIMQASGEDPMLVEEYNKYVFDLLEQRPNAKPMSFADFKRMVKAGMKDGGIMATEIPLKPEVKNINKKGQPDTTMVKMKEGGLMDLGGKEMDLRGGGFVPIGKKERADDVPARLSKNEFVMTADAVRAAGGGSVNKGAKRMYNLMNTLEARA